MQGFVQVDTVCVTLPQWNRANKPYFGGGSSRKTRERVARRAARCAVWMDKARYYMGLVNGQWVPVGAPDQDCAWYCVADDTWHGATVNVTFYKREG